MSAHPREITIRSMVATENTDLHSGFLSEALVCSVDFTGRPDLAAWLGYLAVAGSDASAGTWVGRPTRSAPNLTLDVATEKPVPSSFRLTIPVDTRSRIDWLRRVEVTGWIGVTPVEVEPGGSVVRVHVPAEHLGRLLDRAERLLSSGPGAPR